MIKEIKERVKAWKRFYTKGHEHVDENSSWQAILMELEYYRSDIFYSYGYPKLSEAVADIGLFSDEERHFLNTLPAYIKVKEYLSFDCNRKDYVDKIDGLDVFFICSAKDDGIPIREITIVTDREDLWGLEIYIFKASYFFRCSRHGIIRYDKEPPEGLEPGYIEDLPF
ncbi:MAG: hypothetical protein J6W96_02270 [Alphaproteobacteria bacterium]|nr:hypothetical protein [Alphaproteobacteria bacterium]